jgi:DNA-binding HxlR family transcriptional regulator
VKKRKETSTDFANEQLLKRDCPFIFALSLMGQRWKPAILWKIAGGVSRFGHHEREIPPISEKMLTQHISKGTGARWID